MLRRSLLILAVIFAFAMIESSNAKSSSRRYHMKYFKREFEPENFDAARERLRVIYTINSLKCIFTNIFIVFNNILRLTYTANY
jgi:hypothetical protein